MFDLDKLTIRQEQVSDHSAVYEVVKEAFGELALSDKTEHLLVERLRKTPEFIPELSLVAEFDGQIIGHVIVTKVRINNGKDKFPSLALAPISVLPAYQGHGIGGELIREAHEVAKQLQQFSIVVIGHKDFFLQFGYQRASTFNLKLPFEAPDENCFAIELNKDSLKGISGSVEYSRAFAF